MNYINEKRLLDTFLRLVAIDSESYQESAMASHLKKILEEMRIEYYEDRASERLREVCHNTLGIACQPGNNLYACLKGNLPDENANREKAVLFSSHMDTVSPGKAKKAIVHEDGKITSDGTTVLGADDAAGIAEIIEVLRVVQENDLPHPDIEILFPTAEEPYCQGSRLFDYNRIHSRIAYVLDMSGEIGRAAYAAPAITSLYIRVLGKASHAGFAPEEGVHALAIASKAIARLQFGHVEEETTVNIGTIQGGAGKNIVPEEVYMTGEIRSMSSERVTYWTNQVIQTFEEEAAKLGGCVEWRAEKEFDAYCVDQDEEVVTLFCRAAEEIGLEAGLMKTYGGSDNNNFNAHGIRGLVVANGMSEVHSVRESSKWQDQVKACQLILQIIHNLAVGE